MSNFNFFILAGLIVTAPHQSFAAAQAWGWAFLVLAALSSDLFKAFLKGFRK